MLALIPGFTATLAYLRPQPSASPPRQEGFAQVLAAAPRNVSSPEPPPPSPPRYEVQPGDNLTVIAQKLGYDDPMVLARANHLKNPDLLRIGQVLNLPEKTPDPHTPVLTTKLAQPPVKSSVSRSQAAPAVNHLKRRQLVVASWYGSQHHGKLMANGKPFNMYADTVAHKKMPLGTRLTLTNPKNGSTVKVQVTDRGPYIPGRNLDLSYGAARKLGVVKTGVAKLWMEEG